MQSLFSVEGWDEEERYCINESKSMYELVKRALGVDAYIDLMECGREIDGFRYAEIEQSDKFSFSIEFKLYSGVATFYKVYGGVSENDRNDSNCSIFSVKFEVLERILKNIPAGYTTDDCTFFDLIKSEVARQMGNIPSGTLAYSPADVETVMQFYEAFPDHPTNIFK